MVNLKSISVWGFVVFGYVKKFGTVYINGLPIISAYRETCASD